MARARVSRDQWIDAAVKAIARGGIGAVAVDVLAREMGITRGSFYWHFGDRDELVGAALEYWERAGTEGVIAAIGAIDDPRDRLLELFTTAVSESVEGFEVSLGGDAAHPLVAPVLARVTERRLGYLAELFRGLGDDDATARRQAVTAYALYVGWIHLRHSTPAQVPELRLDAPDRRDTILQLVAALQRR